MKPERQRFFKRAVLVGLTAAIILMVLGTLIEIWRQ